MNSPVVVFDAVACPAVGSCTALGVYIGFDAVERGVFETLSKGTWTAADAPLPANGTGSSIAFAQNNGASALACPAIGSCVAAAGYTDASGHLQGVLETLSGGTWTATEAPVRPTPPANPRRASARWPARRAARAPPSEPTPTTTGTTKGWSRPSNKRAQPRRGDQAADRVLAGGSCQGDLVLDHAGAVWCGERGDREEPGLFRHPAGRVVVSGDVRLGPADPDGAGVVQQQDQAPGGVAVAPVGRACPVADAGRPAAPIRSSQPPRAAR